MPRSSRLDAPGLLHHIMIRGIKEKREVNNALQAELLALNAVFESVRAGKAGIGLALEAEALRNIAGRIFAVREKTGT